MHSSFLKLCCAIFILQVMLSSIASGHNLRMLNAQSQQDVLAICTGSETKWISAQRYFDFGEIIEVEQDSDNSDTHLLLACANSLAYDNKPVSLAALEITPTPIYSLSNVSRAFLSIVFVQRAHTLASSRAPPSSILV